MSRMNSCSWHPVSACSINTYLGAHFFPGQYVSSIEADTSSSEVKAANDKICLVGSLGSGLSVPAWRHNRAIIKRTHERGGIVWVFQV